MLSKTKLVSLIKRINSIEPQLNFHSNSELGTTQPQLVVDYILENISFFRDTWQVSKCRMETLRHSIRVLADRALKISIRVSIRALKLSNLERSRTVKPSNRVL